MCETIDSFPDIPAGECLKDQEVLISALGDARSSGNKEFFAECHSFIRAFVKLLSRNVCSTSKLAKGLYSLCPDILFDGDDEYVFRLFATLTNCLLLGYRIDLLLRERW